MRRIRIVADSSADILTLEGVEYAFAPMKIITADREFVDDETLDVEEMATFLYTYKGKSKSSCPNVSDWLETFGDAEDVICVTITSALSGSYNAACTAKTEKENVITQFFTDVCFCSAPVIGRNEASLFKNLCRAGDVGNNACKLFVFVKI